MLTHENTPNTNHITKNDVVSIRLKHNRWTGARYETDQWIEARYNEDKQIYDIYHCEAKWLHSRGKTTYCGQSNKCIIEDMSVKEANQLIEGTNYHARDLERKNRNNINPDRTKLYQAFYPLKQRFMRLVKGEFKLPKTPNADLLVFKPEDSSGYPILKLPNI